MHLLLVSLALAAPSAPPSPPPAPRSSVYLGASLVGEAVQDSAIAAVYGDTSLSGEVAVAMALPWGLEAGIRAGYRRLGGFRVDGTSRPSADATWIWFAPVSATVGPTYRVGALTVGAAVGPAWVVWSEQSGGDAEVGYNGAKWGVLFEGAVRYELPGTEPSLHDPTHGPLGMQIEGTIGYRASALRHGEVCGGETSCGLDFGALRLGLGLRVRL